MRQALDDALRDILDGQGEQERSHPQFESLESFQKYLSDLQNEKSDMARRITATNEDIQKAIQYTFSSEEESAQAEKDEIELLNINVDDSKVDLELYKKLINKFFASIRY